MENVKRIGLMMWEGKFPNYVKDIIKLNSFVFDTLYILAPTSEHILDYPNLEFLDSSILRNHIENLTYEGIGSAAISDFITYAPFETLSLYGIKVEKVMIMDCDYLVYNKHMITRLFDAYENSFIGEEESTYPDNYGEKFFNPGVGFIVKNDIIELRNNWISTVISDRTYGSGSARMLFKMKDTMKSLHMPPNYNTRMVRSFDGHEIKTDHNTLGVHFESSLYFRYYPSDIKINDMRIELDLSKGAIIISPFSNINKSGVFNDQRF